MEFGGAVEFGGPGEGLRHFVGRPGILGRLSQGGLSEEAEGAWSGGRSSGGGMCV